LAQYGVPGAAEAYYANPARPPLTDEEWQQHQAKRAERLAQLRKLREERMQASKEKINGSSEHPKSIGDGDDK
jgi:hypothetical protein